MDFTQGAAERLSHLLRYCYRNPWVAIAAWVLVLSVSIVGVASLKVDTSTASFLDTEGPEWITYTRSVELHGSDEFIVITLESARAWDESALAKVESLTTGIEKIPGVYRVDSLATVPLIRSDAGSILVDPGLSDGIFESAEEMAKFVDTVQVDRLARDSLVSRDGKVFAINVILDPESGIEQSATVAAIRGLVSPETTRITGVPIFRTAVNSRMSAELRIFVPATIALLVITILVAIPSIAAILAPLSVSTVAMCASLGAMGYAGVPLSLSTMLLPSTLLALGTAYGMHLVASSQDVADLAGVSFPVALSGLTTAIGFGSMSAVPISAIRELAMFGALGVVVGTAAALTLAPAILSLRPVGRRRSRVLDWIKFALSKHLCKFVQSHQRELLVAWGVVVVTSIVGLVQLRVSTDIVMWFAPDSDVRVDYEETRRTLSGISPVNVLIEKKSDDSPDLDSAELVAMIDTLAGFLVESAEVGKALSIGDPLRAVGAAFRDSDDFSLPETDQEVSQSLLLLSGMGRLDDVLHTDRRSANILLRVDNNSSDDIVDLQHVVSRWWRLNGDDRYRVEVTGIMYEFARSEEAIAHGQIKGLVLASVSIAIILLAVFRQGVTAGIALAANVVPIAIGFGTMGMLGVPLDAGTICVGSLALGIAVDDTVHLLSAFRLERARSENPCAALLASFRRVLPAVAITTVAISIGFAVLSLSEFSLVRNLGLVTSALILLCLIADATLLPALLLGGIVKRSGRMIGTETQG